MDSLIAAAARALAEGDVLRALNDVALRDDPPALAMRGIAMARLGEFPRARELLRRAARSFGAKETVARARCVVAEAEVALAMRDIGASSKELAAARDILDAHADHANAVQARLIALRRLLLLGRLDEAADALTKVDVPGLPPPLATVAALVTAELALRSLRVGAARSAFVRARDAAARASLPSLSAEVAEAELALERPAARRIVAGQERLLQMQEVAALVGSTGLVVDACRRGLRRGTIWIPLARRPVLFVLARMLGEAWPGDVDRRDLIAGAFRTRRPDETHRARLRVEIGRLRRLVAGIASIDATARGFLLRSQDAGPVAVIAPPIDGEQASLVALLSDGAAWSTSALALAMGASQRSVQRALAGLETEGRVRSVGSARARRWLAPTLAGFTTILLLPSLSPP